MNHKLISLMSVQLLRVVRLVRAIEAIQIAKGRWGLVVHGRGFTRLLAVHWSRRISSVLRQTTCRRYVHSIRSSPR